MRWHWQGNFDAAAGWQVEIILTEDCIAAGQCHLYQEGIILRAELNAEVFVRLTENRIYFA